MKVKITLSGSGGELDSKLLEIEDEDDPMPEIQDAVDDMIGEHPWDVGDTFTITEVES